MSMPPSLQSVLQVHAGLAVLPILLACSSLAAQVRHTRPFYRAMTLSLVLGRYTGYIQGLMETYAQTPIPAQLQTKQPPTSSFLFTRTYVPPVSTPARDPCNFPDTYKPRHAPVNLWPQLQSKGEHPAWCSTAATRLFLCLYTIF